MSVCPHFYPAAHRSLATLVEIYAQDSVKSCRHISSLIPIKTDFVDERERERESVCGCVSIWVCKEEIKSVCVWVYTCVLEEERQRERKKQSDTCWENEEITSRQLAVTSFGFWSGSIQVADRIQTGFCLLWQSFAPGPVANLWPFHFIQCLCSA